MTPTESVSMSGSVLSRATSSTGRNSSRITRKPLPVESCALSPLPQSLPSFLITGTTYDDQSQPRRDSSTLGPWGTRHHLIPTDLEVPPQASPKVGPKSASQQPHQRGSTLSTVISPSDSISVAVASRPRQEVSGSGTVMSSRSKRPVDGKVYPRQEASRSVANRQISTSSALNFRSRATPETHLDFSEDQASSMNNSLAGTAKPPRSMDVVKQKDPTAKRQSSASSRDSQQRGQTGNHTDRSKKSLAPRSVADGKVCLHTHHHHYWIVSDPNLLPQKDPALRSSKDRRPVQQANKNSRFDGTMDSWPSEGEVEALAELQRPQSSNTNQRYFIAG